MGRSRAMDLPIHRAGWHWSGPFWFSQHWSATGQTKHTQKPYNPRAANADGQVMPITPFLDDPKFDPETKRVVGVAFEIARVALRLAERSDLADEMIAKRIIELAGASAAVGGR